MRRARTLMTTIMAVFIIAATCITAAAASHTGTITETITGGGYTYMNIKENGQDFWIAGPENTVAKGASVSFGEQIWMTNFTSKALGRTFPKILFVSGVQGPSDAKAANAKTVKAANAKAAPSHGPAAGTAKMHTIEEILDNKNDLDGQLVSFKGTVVKVTENIMNRTWVHIEDSGGRKLVCRSVNDTAALDSVVTATGRLATDVDFGFGYFYPAIVEDATFSK